MFDEILAIALKPLFVDNLNDNQINQLASEISNLIEVNPREGSKVPFLRDAILDYLTSDKIIQHLDKQDLGFEQ